jgi:bZIP transcription factor
LAGAPKKRGRKLTETEKYKNDSETKIEGLKTELKKKGLSVAQR